MRLASPVMKPKILSIFTVLAGVLAAVGYIVEPYALTFIDDGPYYSGEFSGPVSELPVNSQIELRRFGQLAYLLESRALPVGDKSVLVLRGAGGAVKWARIPMKPDGDLGQLEFRGANITWYGGWCIRIKPESQEGGYLYLGSFGGFRFFNHSW